MSKEKNEKVFMSSQSTMITTRPITEIERE